MNNYSLIKTNGRLSIKPQINSCVTANIKPIYIDFLATKLTYRRHTGGGTKQLIAKAVGITNKFKPMVIDATAGLGTDAFILSSLGCEVLMIERSPIIGALLNDGLSRAYEQDIEFKKLKLQLTIADAREYLNNLIKKQLTEHCENLQRDFLYNNTFPDVIYLDPMYPERNKTALNKKEMRVIREIVGDDLDASELLKIALKCSKKRVVVKRPRLAPILGNDKPDIVFKGKSCRFDVFLI